MPEKKKKPQSPSEIYDRRAMALANALEAKRDGGDPRGENPRMDDRSFALAQAARRALAKEKVAPLAAGERGLDRLAPYSTGDANVYATPEVITRGQDYGRDYTRRSGYNDESAMRGMLAEPSRRARRSEEGLNGAKERRYFDEDAMREAFFRPGEGRGTIMAADLPISTRVQPEPGQILREPGGRSGLIPTPPYVGDYDGSYDWESELYGPPTGSGASTGEVIPEYEGGVSRFMPERLPTYRQTLRHAIAYQSLYPSDGFDPTARANLDYADSPAGKRPFNPGERDRLAAPQKRAAKKGK